MQIWSKCSLFNDTPHFLFIIWVLKVVDTGLVCVFVTLQLYEKSFTYLSNDIEQPKKYNNQLILLLNIIFFYENRAPLFVNKKSSREIHSCFKNPLFGNLPARTISITATTEDDVVQDIAVCMLPAISMGR